MLAPEQSSAGQAVLTARSEQSDPAAAVRETLRAIAAQLAKAGAGPQHLTAMTWATPDPGAFHPSRRAVELAYREVFAGFRPKLSFVHAGDPAFVVTAYATLPGPPDPHPVWRTYSAQQLAQQYSPRSPVPDILAVFEQWTKDGSAY